jgi:hypothetical protein
MLTYADGYYMQLLTLLVTEPAESERRNKMCQTVVDKLNPFLQNRGVGIVSVDQRPFDLAPSLLSPQPRRQMMWWHASRVRSQV